MTGPERLELASSMEFVRDALTRIENKVDSLDGRVQKIELSSAQQMGVAAGTAAAVAAQSSSAEGRRRSVAFIATLAASVATVFGVVIGIAIQVFVK